jgi:hypothetical protein
VRDGASCNSGETEVGDGGEDGAGDDSVGEDVEEDDEALDDEVDEEEEEEEDGNDDNADSTITVVGNTSFSAQTLSDFFSAAIISM